MEDGQLSISPTALENYPVLSGITIRPAKQQAADTADEDQKKQEVDQTVTITAGDDMIYDVEEFSIRPGAKVKLAFEHTGQLPAQAMGQDVVILKKPSMNPVSFARRAATNCSVENDYLSDDVREEVLAATDMIGGGKSDTIVFTAPDSPGEYPYMSTFPQHAASMNGDMVVKD